jgi:ESF2/ABP1 family protein
MSQVPPYMHPDGLRKQLEKRFDIGRIFLQAEAENITWSRKKMGGNRKLKYTEGWIEFEKKKDAKMAALVLNNQLMGGKKRHNMFHDDTWNLLYLSKFKWSNLTEKLNYD